MNRDRVKRAAFEALNERRVPVVPSSPQGIAYLIQLAVECAIDAIADELEAEDEAPGAVARAAIVRQAQAQASRRTPY